MKVNHEDLTRLLPRVQKPSRYIGVEANAVIKKSDEFDVHMCLVFPDVYELGMSNTGMRLLYALVNNTERCYAERSFCPWPDMQKQMLEHGIPLYSMETHAPLHEFDLIGITLQTELAYSNIPLMLELSAIPVFSDDRGDNDPLICAGGPCMANPEPVADFFDFFVIGDGEAILPFVLTYLKHAQKQQLSRGEKLRGLAQLGGVYVPSLHPLYTNKEGERISEAARLKNKKSRVKRMWVEDLSNNLYLHHQVVPNIKPTHLRYGIEVMRGCTQGCRFCQAGYWYRPVREMNPDDVLQAMDKGVTSTGLNEFGLLSLSTADYSRLTDLVHMTKNKFLKEMHVNVALPSLRADKFTAQLATELDDVHGNSLTFAPETGSERLRKFINKNITNQQMFEAAEIAYKNGWNNIKLYIMIGIPTETWEDIESIVHLTNDILAIGKKVHKRKTIGLNIGILSPKPFTSLQWDAAGTAQDLQKKLDYLWNSLRPNRDVKISFPHVEEYTVESILARGDRRIARVIYQAYKNGTCFDAWSEHFRYEAWMKAFETCGIDYTRYHRKRDVTEELPWEVIDMGVARGYFRKDRRVADALEMKPDCKWGDCNHCGIPGNYADIKLARKKEADPVELDKLLGKSIHIDKDKSAITPVPYRIVYQKEGWARFISHLDCLKLFERALLRTSVRFKYTEGFHKRLKLAASPALPFGFESSMEILDFFVQDDEVKKNWGEQLTNLLPQGLSVISCRERGEEDFSLSRYTAVVFYRIVVPTTLLTAYSIKAQFDTWQQQISLQVGKPGASANELFESKEWIADLYWVNERELEIGVRYMHNSRSLRLTDFIRGVTGCSEDELLSCLIRKIRLDVQEPELVVA